MQAKSWIPLLMTMLLLAACGPKAQIRPELTGDIKPSIAILPAQYPDGVQRERINYLREILRFELANIGYLVLDDRLVRQLCSSSACPERAELARSYGTNHFFELEVDSTAQIDFFAGYYNAVGGVLRMTDAEGREAVKIAHTEREKGGVVFESGQVLQGIISQVRNRAPESANLLGTRFVRKLVAAVPKPRTDTDLGGVSVRIMQATAAPQKTRNVRKVCVAGTGGGVAAVTFGPHRAALREISPGTYCGIFRLDSQTLNGAMAVAELRSPFGAAARKELAWTSETVAGNGRSGASNKI